MIKKETVYAIRGLDPGDEITMSYHVGGPAPHRGQILKQFFGFDCECELCSLPNDDRARSDARHIQAQLLDEAVGDPKRAQTAPGDVLADIRKLLKLYEVEGVLDSRIHRAYYDAVQLCNMHSDQARTKIFAHRCLKKRIMCEGPNSPGVLELTGIMKCPAKIPAIGPPTNGPLARMRYQSILALTLLKNGYGKR